MLMLLSSKVMLLVQSHYSSTQQSIIETIAIACTEGNQLDIYMSVNRGYIIYRDPQLRR